MPNPDDLRGSEQAKPFNPPSTPTAPHSLQQQIQMACLPRAEWQPIETIPYGAEALFLGELWAHPYVGIRNGSGGMAYLYGFNNPEHGWQAYDATRWMPICDQRGRAANYLKRDDENPNQTTVETPAARLEMARTALADIAFSDDMTLELARAKAKRIYEATA